VPDEESKSIPEVMQELKELTITYAKQETVDPLKSMFRWVGFGVGGSLVLAIGLSLLGLAGLRALQTETGTMFTGNLTWIPYLIVGAALGFIAGMSIYFGPMKDGRAHRDRREADR